MLLKLRSAATAEQMRDGTQSYLEDLKWPSGTFLSPWLQRSLGKGEKMLR